MSAIIIGAVLLRLREMLADAIKDMHNEDWKKAAFDWVS